MHLDVFAKVMDLKKSFLYRMQNATFSFKYSKICITEFETNLLQQSDVCPVKTGYLNNVQDGT